MRRERNGCSRGDENGRIPHRNVLQHQSIRPTDDICRRDFEHATRHQIDPDRIFEFAGDLQIDGLEGKVARRLGFAEPVDAQRIPFATKAIAGECSIATLDLLMRFRERIVVEERIDIAHRVPAWTTVDELLECVRSDEAETLEHKRVLQVDHREQVGRNRPDRITDRAAKIPFRLGILGPFDLRERMGELELTRTADFALHDVKRRRIALHQPTERQRHLPAELAVPGLVGGVGIRRIRMVDEARAEVERVLALQLLEDDGVVAFRHVALHVDRRAVAFRLRLHLAHGPGRRIGRSSKGSQCSA